MDRALQTGISVQRLVRFEMNISVLSCSWKFSRLGCRKREFAFSSFSPINKPWLHWTLHIGNKMVFLSSLLDASSSTLSSHCVQSYFFNPFASTYLSKDLQNSSIFFRDDFCPPTCAHPVLYPTAPCPSPPPFFNSCVRCKKKISYPQSKERYNYHLSSQSFEEFTVYKTGCGCILRDVHLGKGDKGLSLFFPPNSKWLHVCASNMAGAMPEKKKRNTHTKQLANLFILFQGDN